MRTQAVTILLFDLPFVRTTFHEARNYLYHYCSDSTRSATEQENLITFFWKGEQKGRCPTTDNYESIVKAAIGTWLMHHSHTLIHTGGSLYRTSLITYLAQIIVASQVTQNEITYVSHYKVTIWQQYLCSKQYVSWRLVTNSDLKTTQGFRSYPLHYTYSSLQDCWKSIYICS